MNERMCCGYGYHGRIGLLPCARRGTIEREGKRYCYQHDPEAVKARQKASAKRYEQECRDRVEAQEGNALRHPAVRARIKELEAEIRKLKGAKR